MLHLFRVSGASMGPLYQHGDYVLISRSAWRRLRRGDDVVARHGVLGVVLKRISARIGNQLELNGLNALSMTSYAIGPVQNNDLLGRVVWHFRSAERNARPNP